MVLSSWQSHCESLPGSFDDNRTVRFGMQTRGEYSFKFNFCVLCLFFNCGHFVLLGLVFCVVYFVYLSLAMWYTIYTQYSTLLSCNMVPDDTAICSLLYHRQTLKHNSKNTKDRAGHQGSYPFMGTLKPQSNGPLYSNTVIGILAVDGWDITFGAARTASAGCSPAQYPPRCTKCNSSPINSQCTNFLLFDEAL